MKRCAFILSISTVVVIAGLIYLANLGGRNSNPSGFIAPVELSLNIAEAACDWSKGYYMSSTGVQGNKFSCCSPPECTWYVDGKVRSIGWSLLFSVSSGRNAYQWYKNKLVTNGNYGSIGYPGEIMVFDKGSFSSVGHVAYIISNGYWYDSKAKTNKRAWTVRHANWSGSTGQTIIKEESPCGATIKQCTFVEDSKGNLKIQNGSSLVGGPYPLLGFIYKKSAGTVHGKLHIGSASGSALASATVKCGGQSTTTDSKGQYGLAGISPGNQTISFSKSGYQSYSKSVTITDQKDLNAGDNYLTK